MDKQNHCKVCDGFGAVYVAAKLLPADSLPIRRARLTEAPCPKCDGKNTRGWRG